ncbi:hypothetical protein [Poseidonibacter ostreae]|jgi:hypothetical protein|uniref:Uncharacterized protein n=1 Tax=Poseidonibacter ostreae TaxID=2654171 RepID=A0A6L4WWC6_9BACT|nr:hypothetical protein [Poseidonibacter ostreae]KAB7888029.1 hypothetical protein GA417_01315 [Poseidonibacter ostreae]KAB7891052.1 hypothetical protein GBG19_01420 [Poseidonibacter ostreae]KAB7892776.1 hypothetical protein GBG18_01130 [Poseidonibacter ostreae]
MFNASELLENPNNPKFNLKESEIYSFKEANELIKINKYSYSLFAIWNGIVINLQRRIENFGIANLFTIIDDKNNFNEKATNLKERWLNVNEYKIIDYAKNLNIINNTTHDIITTLYWMKSDNNEEDSQKLDKYEIYAIAYLLEKNLILKEFKKDLRVNKINTENNFKRREIDRYNDLNLVPQTHQEMLLRSSIEAFKKDSKEEDNLPSFIDKYC